jgi:thiosulfate reductase cytochrome b subunit
MKRVKIYMLFERIWHWSQAALIIFLAVTGFEVHSSFSLFGYEKAVMFHRTAGWMLIGLIIFAIFWHFTTDEWRQYIPTFKNLKAQIRYYTIGMFRGDPHPVHKSRWQKLNPLQIITYLGFKVLIVPVVVFSGLLYMYHKTINVNNVVIVSNFSLEAIALWHTAGAFLLIAFLIVHVYMTTTGPTATANIRAMITGYEELEQEPGEIGDPSAYSPVESAQKITGDSDTEPDTGIANKNQPKSPEVSQ